MRSGVHHHNKKDCEATNAVQRVLNILSGASKYLFPSSVLAKPLPVRKKLKVPRGNGGWGDLRDKALCLGMATALPDESAVDNVLQAAKDRIRAAGLDPVTEKKPPPV